MNNVIVDIFYFRKVINIIDIFLGEVQSDEDNLHLTVEYFYLA